MYFIVYLLGITDAERSKRARIRDTRMHCAVLVREDLFDLF